MSFFSAAVGTHAHAHTMSCIKLWGHTHKYFSSLSRHKSNVRSTTVYRAHATNRWTTLRVVRAMIILILNVHHGNGFCTPHSGAKSFSSMFRTVLREKMYSEKRTNNMNNCDRRRFFRKWKPNPSERLNEKIMVGGLIRVRPPFSIDTVANRTRNARAPVSRVRGHGFRWIENHLPVDHRSLLLPALDIFTNACV